MRYPDRLALVLILPMAMAFALPFAGMRPNRIAPSQGELLPSVVGWPLAACLAGIAVAALLSGRFRMPLSILALASWLWGMGAGASWLTVDAGNYARVSPAAGFWIGAITLVLLLTDTLARSRPGPLARIAMLGLAGIAGILVLGSWDRVSILQEYASRRNVFWAEGARHLQLTLGSFVAAIVVGIPAGILIHRVKGLQSPAMGVLTAIQTIPSIALFGLLILPLGWVAAHVPGARAMGIGGIGMAPAFVALFLYALLPMVTNTVAGLRAVPPSVTEAARGMGLAPYQRLLRIDVPLALPVILTGARIVLVQNIGLATIGALIGAGGFGTFVFQGLGQTAPDLILLGALPTVALAFAAQVVFNAVIDGLPGKRA